MAKQTGLVAIAPKLDTFAWEAVTFDVVAHLHDAQLQVELALHSERLAALKRLNDTLFERATGPNHEALCSSLSPLRSPEWRRGCESSCCTVPPVRCQTR
jgi:hypothetical protein